MPYVEVHAPLFEKAIYGNDEKLPWKEEFRPLPSTVKDGTERIWDALYETLRHNKPFPITLEQSYKVIEVIGKSKGKHYF